MFCVCARVFVARKRKLKSWEENDYYDSDDDTFLDRTGSGEAMCYLLLYLHTLIRIPAVTWIAVYCSFVLWHVGKHEELTVQICECVWCFHRQQTEQIDQSTSSIALFLISFQLSASCGMVKGADKVFHIEEIWERKILIDHCNHAVYLCIHAKWSTWVNLELECSWPMHILIFGVQITVLGSLGLHVCRPS